MNITQAAFIIAVLGIVWSIYRLHLNPSVNFNMLDLLLENGKVSKVSCLVMGSFFVTSWIIVDLQAHGKMTEGFLSIYAGAWVAPLLVRLFNPSPANTSTTTAIVTTSESTANPPSTSARLSGKSARPSRQ